MDIFDIILILSIVFVILAAFFTYKIVSYVNKSQNVEKNEYFYRFYQSKIKKYQAGIGLLAILIAVGIPISVVGISNEKEESVDGTIAVATTIATSISESTTGTTIPSVVDKPVYSTTDTPTNVNRTTDEPIQYTLTAPTITTTIATTAPVSTEKTTAKSSTTTKPKTAATTTTTAARTTTESAEYIYGYETYYEYGYYYPEAVSNSNTFGTGTAQATVTSIGVTAGYNASGSINSTNTVLAVQRYFREYPSATALYITIPSGATAMSPSTARKIINAAGSGKTVYLVSSTSFGSLSYTLSTARNYYFSMLNSGKKYNNARSIIVRAYGNSDICGFSMSTNSLGASGTFRIKVASLGLSANVGDTIYALFYNPATNGFTRKSLVVNSNGEIAYATTRGGVHLYSKSQFTK
jgi:hypothetical protein